MKQSGKKKVIIFILCAGLLSETVFGHMGRLFERSAVAADLTISMTDYYNNGTYKTVDSDYCITICDKKELLLFRKCIAENRTEGMSFEQTGDISFHENEVLENISVEFCETDNSWMESKGIFQGSYHGNGHTIRGVILENSTEMSGFFGSIGTSGMVSNLVFEDVTFENCAGGIVAGVNAGVIEGCTIRNAACSNQKKSVVYLGSVTGVNQGTIQKVAIENVKIDSTVGSQRDALGGIAGTNQKKILSCMVQETVIRGAKNDVIGGIAGTAYSQENAISFKNCVSRANIWCAENGYAGGIAGYVGDEGSLRIGEQSEIDILLCHYGGRIKVNEGDFAEAFGGIVGEMNWKSAEITQCKNVGIITAGALYVGGIIGELRNGGTLDQCLHEGRIEEEEITSQYCVGGIAGRVQGASIMNCANQSDILFERRDSYSGEKKICVGGLVGNIETNADAMLSSRIENSYNVGKLSGNCVGGIVGYFEQKADFLEITFSNCVSLGEVADGDEGFMGTIVGANPWAGESMCPCYCYQKIRVCGNFSMNHPICYFVSEEDIRGIPDGLTIGLIYAEYDILLTCLNAWVNDNQVKKRYLAWEQGRQGYPVLCFTKTLLSEIPGEITETPTIEAPDEEQPEETEKPSEESFEKEAFALKLNVYNLKTVVHAKGWVNVSCNVSEAAEGVCIYRAKADGEYKKIATIRKSKVDYSDKTAKKGKKYSYAVKAFGDYEGERVFGKKKTKAIMLPWCNKPVIQLKKGILSGGQRYVEVRLVSYDGTNVEIYTKLRNSKYMKIGLKSSVLKKRIRLAYDKTGFTLFCKVRTYRKVNGKKRYSEYSDVQTIKL